jgi:hypothetical protein
MTIVHFDNFSGAVPVLMELRNPCRHAPSGALWPASILKLFEQHKDFQLGIQVVPQSSFSHDGAF